MSHAIVPLKWMAKRFLLIWENRVDEKMWVIYFLFLFFYSVGVEGQGAANGPGGGPDGVDFCLVIVSSIYVCPDDESQSFASTEKVLLNRVNESHSYITGNMVFKKCFPGNVMAEIVLDKAANGRNEMVMSYEIENVCDEKKNPDSPFLNYLDCLGFPDKCPFDAGAYPVHNMTVDTDGLPVNSANAGEYQATINLYNCLNTEDCKNNKEFIACMKLDCLIEPC